MTMEKSNKYGLTGSEKELLRYICIHDATFLDAASHFSRSIHTIEKHIKNIKSKMGTSSNTHTLIKYLVSDPDLREVLENKYEDL